MYLLSNQGERREDRIPIGIFSSLDEIRVSFVKENILEEYSINSAYDANALIFITKGEWYEEDTEDTESYIAEHFDLNPVIWSNPDYNIRSEVIAIADFKNAVVIETWKDRYLEFLKVKGLNSSYGVNPFEIYSDIGGTEIQARELLNLLIKEEKVSYLGETKNKKFFVSELKDDATKVYNELIRSQMKPWLHKINWPES